MKIITRKDAKKSGLRYYFTAEPCVNGHITKRYVANHTCAECVAMRKPTYVPAEDYIADDHRMNTMATGSEPSPFARIKLPQKVLDSTYRDYKYVSYQYAHEVVNNLGLKSVKMYQKWVHEYCPAGFSMHPELLYQEWDNWNVFLNTNNKYGGFNPVIRKNERLSYWEACALVQPFGFRSLKEYKAAFDAGRIPKGIHRNPTNYSEYKPAGSLGMFLGKDPKYIIAAAKNIQPLLVLYNTSQANSNIISIKIHKNTTISLKEEITKNNIPVIKIYNWYEDFAAEIFNLMDRLGKRQNESTWIFNNVNEILYELDTVLEVFKF